MSIKKLSSAGLIALSLSMGAVGTVCTSAAPALAAPTPYPTPSYNTSTIDQNGTYQLNITKILGANTNQTNDGTQQTVAGDKLQGVPFDIYQVQGVDLTTNDGWAKATDLQGVSITQADIAKGTITGKSGTVYTLTKVATVTTDANGVATYDGKAGLYLFNENLSGVTSVTDTTTGKTVAASTLTPSLPSLVTLPMTNPTDTSTWMDTVYVYPKNSSSTATKAVKDLGSITGDTGTAATSTASHLAEYTVTGDITPSMDGKTMGEYKITDVLDSRLTYTKTVSVYAGKTALTEGTDYTVTVTGQTVVLSMTQSGLDKLAAAKSSDAGAQVTWVFDTTVNAEGTSGDIPNTAAVIPNQGWADQHPGSTGVPTNTVESKYGNLTLTKVDGSDPTKTLAGATFDVYATMGTSMTAGDDQAACNTAVNDPTKKILTGMATDSAGKLTITGLQESDFYNNVQQPATGGSYIVYCLVETKAPTGYNLLAQSVPFTINQAASTGAVLLTVKNEAHNLTNSLPLTGGNGAAALGVGGLVLLGAGAALVVARRRHADDDLADELA